MKKLSKKQASIVEIIVTVCVLATAIGIITPIICRNVVKGQEISIRLESKSNAKEAWENYTKSCNIDSENSYEFYWNDGKYYWVVDKDGTITDDETQHPQTKLTCDSTN